LLGITRRLAQNEGMLTGDFVRLEPFAPRHLHPLWEAAAGHAGRFALTQVPKTVEEMKAYLEEGMAAAAEGAMVPFATVRLADERVVGSTRFCNLERWRWPYGRPARAAAAPDAVEIGWTWLTPTAQRTAVNTEAKRLMLAYAFETWGVERVTLKTDERNAQSRAGIERLGARLDGLLRAHLPAADGGVRTSAVYSILAAEWPAVRARLTAATGGREHSSPPTSPSR
jgi:N-acetyltransferase